MAVREKASDLEKDSKKFSLVGNDGADLHVRGGAPQRDTCTARFFNDMFAYSTAGCMSAQFFCKLAMKSIGDEGDSR